MNKTTRYLIVALSLIIAGLIIWRFSNIFVYIILAFVISMVGTPLVDLLQKIHIKKFHLPRWLCSLLTLFFIWTLIFSFFRIFVPLLGNELQYFKNVEVETVVASLDEPLAKLEDFAERFNLLGDETLTVEGDETLTVEGDETQIVKGWATEAFTSVISVEKITNVFSGLVGTIASIYIAFVAISCISFFFMKEAKLFENAVVAFFPEDKVENASNAISTISRLLKRYFIGVSLQITGIIILNTAGLSIVGLEFNHAITIALFSGILNVVPYVGPLIALGLGLIIGTAVSIPMDFSTELLPLLIFIVIAMEFTQVIDNVVFQPLIFGTSVKAHPLEIFIVILSAGTLAGVVGMIVAIPSYTVLRVIGKEFFSQIKFVRKLTEKM